MASPGQAGQPQLPLPVPQGCHMNRAESADLPVPETDSGVLGEVLWHDPGDICQFVPPVAVLRARVQLWGNEMDLEGPQLLEVLSHTPF